MRPLFVAWLGRHGLPVWLCPEYFQLASLATLLGASLALQLAARDGASRKHTAYAIAWAYVGALVGGYLFEALRAVPEAIATLSWRPIVNPGRAAYGGLLFAIAAAAIYLNRAREPLAPFFDRVAIGVGLTFALVRTGCFLAGCDYGLPTAHVWGVRFPPGSLAALDHVRRGFVPRGASSLPVHPTELYEVGVGLVAAGLAAVPVLRGRRDGRAFATFLGTYAVGRFAIEFLRGDRDRGLALGLSTAQWVSIALVAALVARRCRRRGATYSVGGRSPEGTASAKRLAKCSAGRASAGSRLKSGTAGEGASLAKSSSISRLERFRSPSAARSSRPVTEVSPSLSTLTSARNDSSSPRETCVPQTS
jgi:prolipoprotein diacylglyceryltransferase